VKKSTKIRLGFAAAIAFALMSAYLPKPAHAVTCYSCRPDLEDGRLYCKPTPHGRTVCSGDGGDCVLSGAVC
jgi:hypothetical protein